MPDYATPTDYEVLQFKKGDFQDQNGNYWCDTALKGVGEPVRIVVKDPTQYHDGMTLFGHITTETSKAGKQYLRFRKDRKDEYQQTNSNSVTSPSPTYQRDDHTQESIARSVALKAAVDYAATAPKQLTRETVIDVADSFLAWLQGGSTTPSESEKSNVAQYNNDSSNGVDRGLSDERAVEQYQNSFDEPEYELPPEFLQ